MTTFLVARKVLSNWLYWVVIDAVSVYLYWSRGLDIYALLMLVYTGMAVYGYLQWKKNYDRQIVPESSNSLSPWLNQNWSWSPVPSARGNQP